LTTTSRLLLWARADQVAYIRCKTVPGGDTPLTVAGFAFRFVVRDKAGNLIAAKTTGGGNITIANGVMDDLVTPTGGTNDMALVAFTDDDLDVAPGTEYQGALWRTDPGSESPFWSGQITIEADPRI
jgi:hypothetical protein